MFLHLVFHDINDLAACQTSIFELRFFFVNLRLKSNVAPPSLWLGHKSNVLADRGVKLFVQLKKRFFALLGQSNFLASVARKVVQLW